MVELWGMIRLGASVEENAQATLDELLGTSSLKKGDERHVPARADIQKTKDVYDLWQECGWDALGSDTWATKDLIPEHAENVDQARTLWNQKYALNQTEQNIVVEYQHSMQMLEDPQRAFTQTIAKLRADGDQGLQSLNDSELKKFVGQALKKYEQQNWPMLFQGIQKVLDDAYRRGPLESYKLWPRMVQWVKDKYDYWLWHQNPGLNRTNMSPHGALSLDHIVDVVTEGGAILSKLRAENKIPQNFDANQLDLREFEGWLMDWKRDNREAEGQGEVIYEYPDGWTMQKLTTSEQLQYEGDEMGHCVGGYSRSVGEGRDIIYSLRDKKGQPHVTMEIDALEGPEALFDPEDDEIPEDAILNHVYYHPDNSNPGDHLSEVYDRPNKTHPKYQPSGKHPFEIVQIQGTANNTPKPEYQAKVKEFLDYLREKGWNFVRSDNWYGNYDAEDEGDGEYPERIEEASDLDNWWDDHYRLQHGLYRKEEGKQDAYGMDLPSQRMKPAVKDWDELLISIVGSLVEEYDPGRYRGRWDESAWQVYHAYVADMHHDEPDQDQMEAEKKGLENAIMTAEDKLQDWEWNNEYYAMQDRHTHDEIVDKCVEHLEQQGQWEAFEKELIAEHGAMGDPDDEWDKDQIYEMLQQEEPDLLAEIVSEEVNKYYSGDAHKFLNYLYQLVNKHGLVKPNDLPDPNERYGGLPEFETLSATPWPKSKGEQPTLPTPPEEIPGTFSRTITSTFWHVAPEFNHDSIATQGLVPDQRDVFLWKDPDTAEAYRAQQERATGQPYETWEVADAPVTRDLGGYVQAGGIPSTALRSHGWGTPSPASTIAIPGTFAKVATEDIQIYPIDREHNMWFDEEGNERKRYRLNWAQDPTTGKWGETPGEDWDSFVDHTGRQGQGYVAYHGDRPVASLTYVDDPAGWYMLGSAYTHPEYRDQGIFNKLVAPLRETGKPIDGYVWHNPWLKNKVRSWR